MTKRSDTRPATGDRGQQTRERIVELALRLATVRGLDGISVGRLARGLKISKSGLFAHFGSKENLQAAVVERASLLFFNHVQAPAEDAGLRGIERLWAVCDNWLSFVDTGVLPGGYFFTGAFFQCAGQRGAIPRQISDVVRRWIDTLRIAVEAAQREGELHANVKARQAALELNSILLGAQCFALLGYKDKDSARSAILAKMAFIATEKIPTSAFDSLTSWRDYLESREQ